NLIKVGEGSYGIVKKAVCLKTGEYVALKVHKVGSERGMRERVVLSRSAERSPAHHSDVRMFYQREPDRDGDAMLMSRSVIALFTTSNTDENANICQEPGGKWAPFNMILINAPSYLKSASLRETGNVAGLG
ncbi:hypothetical protein XENOCAPTIV_015213, partial [Xenoophorus captivus]